MSELLSIQFIEDGSAENPFAPRTWAFVPRVGDSVRMRESQRVYRVTAVEWDCGEGAAGGDELHVTVRLTE